MRFRIASDCETPPAVSPRERPLSVRIEPYRDRLLRHREPIVARLSYKARTQSRLWLCELAMPKRSHIAARRIVVGPPGMGSGSAPIALHSVCEQPGTTRDRTLPSCPSRTHARRSLEDPSRADARAAASRLQRHPGRRARSNHGGSRLRRRDDESVARQNAAARIAAGSCDLRVEPARRRIDVTAARPRGRAATFLVLATRARDQGVGRRPSPFRSSPACSGRRRSPTPAASPTSLSEVRRAPSRRARRSKPALKSQHARPCRESRLLSICLSIASASSPSASWSTARDRRRFRTSSATPRRRARARRSSSLRRAPSGQTPPYPDRNRLSSTRCHRRFRTVKRDNSSTILS